jgi:predicted nucleotidyltransferase component of viral defense system
MKIWIWRTLMNRDEYEKQVNLLLDCLPVLEGQNTFALKGGTAINFFVKDLPRLSVDIDLTFLDSQLPRKDAVRAIEVGLADIATLVMKRNRNYSVRELRMKDGTLSKLSISDGSVKIKIEPNFVMRGILKPIVKSRVCRSIRNHYAFDVHDIPVISTDELYAGKICAALSRQHPRDFFDIKVLFEGEGLTRGICSAFVVYLACSPRPMHELLNPNMMLKRPIFEAEFVNMTTEDDSVTFSSLVETRKQLIGTIQNQLTSNEREFLLSLKQGEPKYTLLPYANLDTLPALQWKLLNIRKMDPEKHALMIEKLSDVLKL